MVTIIILIVFATAIYGLFILIFPNIIFRQRMDVGDEVRIRMEGTVMDGEIVEMYFDRKLAKVQTKWGIFFVNFTDIYKPKKIKNYDK